MKTSSHKNALPRRRLGRRPRGFVMVAAIVCLSIAAALMVGVGRMAVASRGAAEARQWRAQACWLADSALDRAAARLRADAQYAGETWEPPAEAFGARGGAARIEVEPVAGRANARRVRIAADYPNDPKHRARKTLYAIIDL